MRQPKEFYQVSYFVKGKGISRPLMSGEYRKVSLKRLREEMEWLESQLANDKKRKVFFGPIFHCQEIKETA